MRNEVVLVLVVVLTMTLLSACVSTQPVQNDRITAAQRLSLSSAVLGEDRDIWVSLPDSYDDDTFASRSYPVIYLFDGDAYVATLHGITHFMASDSVYTYQIPETIVVGVPHTSRLHELTPTTSLMGQDGKEHASFKISGGGPAMLEFLRTELIPFIDRSYRTLPYRIIIGHSLGGLLAIHDLGQPNPIFRGYIAIDPSLWWDDEITLRNVQKRLEQGFDRPCSVYLAKARSQPVEGYDVAGHERAIEELAAQLGKNSSENLRWSFDRFEDERHDTVALPAFSKGLAFIFDGYRPDFYGFFADPQLLIPHYQAVSKKLGLDLLPPEPLVDMLGQWALGEEDVTKALVFFDLNLDNYPSSFHAAASAAAAHVAAGDTASAEAVWREFIAENPGHRRAQEELELLRHN